MDLDNLTLSILLIGFSLFFYGYFLRILSKYYPTLLMDSDLSKPQAFHEFSISIAGGVGLFFSFLIIYFDFVLFRNSFYFEYLSFCTLFFLLGFLDDVKINIYPKIRLVLMIAFLIILVKYNNFYLENTGIEILNNLLKDYKFFSLFFVCLCFLFIINGANLIDGYNGLLGIHSLIILINLFFVNYLNQNNNLANLIFFVILALVIFLIFNFPKAKVFLGDSGSYFLGSFIAITAIKTSLANPNVSSFYFCILLFYLFFEVFFSFFRKLIREKTSPLYPDGKHLHMILYKMLLKKNNDKLRSNYYISVIINLIYFTLIIPAILMMNNGLFCKYYSLILFTIYILAYKIIHEKTK